ncbi:MAG: methenyltetrahydrofolate cyclohydrolase [Thermoplasmata archaeon]|nr:MAG: methenyltetrahydrofolate cyclohydrolase [Thermoplasmata archaeon]
MMVDERVREFLEKVASSSPTPGGGSVAALAGAIACSLSEMVCNLTIGKKKYADVEQEMKKLLQQCSELREKFVQLVDEDARAFDEVMMAFREKRGIQEALKRAAETPLETASTCVAIAEKTREIAAKGNKNSITDAGVAALMAKTAFYSALLNVRINLKEIGDTAYIRRIDEQIKEMEGQIERLVAETMKIVEEWI